MLALSALMPYSMEVVRNHRIMRKIESLMNEAILEALNWKKDNTEVKTDSANMSRVFLYGNHIATIGEDFVQLFDGGRQSHTTKSRLNAILAANGVDGERVYSVSGKWMLRQYNTEQNVFETVFFHSGIVVGQEHILAA